MSEYQVISFDCSYDGSHDGRVMMVKKLNEQVNKMMKDGWQPLGGPSSVGSYIRQAMVKFE